MPKTVDDILAHHGIMGMKWGGGKGGKGKSGKSSKSSGKEKGPSKSEIHGLSDHELRTRINRIQMEKQYAQLTEPQVSAGRKLASDLILNTGKQVAQQYATKYAVKGIEGLLKYAAG